MSHLEQSLYNQITWMKLPAPERELRFHGTRKWRFDFAWPNIKLAVEVEGGTWARGRHSRGSGFAGDAEKYNEAALLGWRILRFTGDQVNSGAAIKCIDRAMRVFGV